MRKLNFRKKNSVMNFLLEHEERKMTGLTSWANGEVGMDEWV